MPNISRSDSLLNRPIMQCSLLSSSLRSPINLVIITTVQTCKVHSSHLYLSHWNLSSVDISAQRGFHSTGAKRMGGHGHDEPAYLHSKHMYNLDRMKSQKLTMSLSVFTAFSIGVGVPIYAVIFQQKKTASA